MIKKILTLTLVGLILLSTFSVACTRRDLSDGDRASIYAAVARQLYTIDHTFGDQAPNWPVVYLLRHTDDGAGNPGRGTEANSSQLAETLQTAIAASLNDLPARLVWIDTQKEVIDERILAVKDNGALITLGNISSQKDGSVFVPASIYFTGTGAGGTTYVVKKVGGVWQITGKTGAQWIS